MDFPLDTMQSTMQSAEIALGSSKPVSPLSAAILPRFVISNASVQPMLPSPFTMSPPSDSASDSTQSLCSDPVCCRCAQTVAPFDFVPISNMRSSPNMMSSPNMGYDSSTFRYQPSQA